MNQPLIAQLQERIEVALGGLVPDGPFAVLDFPDIRNCGDSAIWLGQQAYLAQRPGRRPRYVSRMADLSPRALERAVPDGPIFIHGGGNFGDIWVGHQDFRETVLRRFPRRRVVQFPQSIHYQSPERLEQTKRVIGEHGDFVLLVRDEESQRFAEEHFDCDVRLCPDMAFCIGPLAPAAPPEHAVLAMLRQDKEQSGAGSLEAGDGVPVEDWISEDPASVRRAKARGAARALLAGRPRDLRLGSFDAAAQHRFSRGITQISRGEVVITDRLHVHICCVLLNKPHAVLDNSYGKIRRFMDAFSGSTPLAYRASSTEDALRWAREEAPRLAAA